MEDNIKAILEGLGCSVEDENFKETPQRVRKAFEEILAYQDKVKLEKRIKEIISKSFPTEYRGIVAQKHIQTVSMCPHHMQPIKYSIDLAYIPKERAVGLSKLVRLTQALSARMELQESLTHDLADVLYQDLDSEGSIVVVRGEHGCMTNRGVRQSVITTTSAVRGIFETDKMARDEFLQIIKS